ncbi:MAG: multiple resistance and pH regulation protein F [Elusimicrobia bacterium]|nr:multiple resistance and pH regulation protein F [Candidatus Liberimonas magnetica]
MKKIYWILILIFLAAFAVMNLAIEIPLLFRFLNPLILTAFLCLLRICYGPTPADRAVSIDIMGILIISFCGIFTIFSKFDFFIDIAIAWALQSYIATLAMAKYLEGRTFDE